MKLKDLFEAERGHVHAGRNPAVFVVTPDDYREIRSEARRAASESARDDWSPETWKPVENGKRTEYRGVDVWVDPRAPDGRPYVICQSDAEDLPEDVESAVERKLTEREHFQGADEQC